MKATCTAHHAYMPIHCRPGHNHCHLNLRPLLAHHPSPKLLIYSIHRYERVQQTIPPQYTPHCQISNNPYALDATVPVIAVCCQTTRFEQWAGYPNNSPVVKHPINLRAEHQTKDNKQINNQRTSNQMNDRTNQTTEKWTSKQMKQWTNKQKYQQFNKLTNQGLNKPKNEQPMNKQSNDQTNQWSNEPMNQQSNVRTIEQTNQPTIGWANQWSSN